MNLAKPMGIEIDKSHKRQLNLSDAEGFRMELMEPDAFAGQTVPPSTVLLPPTK